MNAISSISPEPAKTSHSAPPKRHTAESMAVSQADLAAEVASIESLEFVRNLPGRGNGRRWWAPKVFAPTGPDKPSPGEAAAQYLRDDTQGREYAVALIAHLRRFPESGILPLVANDIARHADLDPQGTMLIAFWAEIGRALTEAGR